MQTIDDMDMYGDDEQLDGLGDPRRRLAVLSQRYRRVRSPKRRARLRRRMARVARRAGIVPPGRRSTEMQKFMLPNGQVVCPGPGDLIHISDEPVFEKQFFTNLALITSPITFFGALTRPTNGVAVSSLLQASEIPYDADFDSIGVGYLPVDQGTAALNTAMQRFYELLHRGTLVFEIQSKTNYAFPVPDCPAGTGLGMALATTENNMRLVTVQNGDPSKGRRYLPHPLAIRAGTKFNVQIHLAAADVAAIVALGALTSPVGLAVHLYGPEGQPLVPAAAGGLMSPEGIMGAASIRG